ADRSAASRTAAVVLDGRVQRSATWRAPWAALGGRQPGDGGDRRRAQLGREGGTDRAEVDGRRTRGPDPAAAPRRARRAKGLERPRGSRARLPRPRRRAVHADERLATSTGGVGEGERGRGHEGEARAARASPATSDRAARAPALLRLAHARRRLQPRAD